ncbi:probable cytochrome P450 301a1, mitochondrial [Nephila pilipes]|uniref:Probable cytochrome P450 301a1, mitochondrial n=1 Tax=Nephila pilipes TaxID=299642 RepID=A0A8X6UJM1_NEPPI|nr:probable cytochrome P450 301a1, mitochondrial [Nephila pilipes]
MAVPGFLRQFQRHFSKVYEPYWVKLLKDGRHWDYEAIPVVGPVFEEYKNFKIHEAYARWCNEHGNVVREVFPSGGSCVHLYHQEDIAQVYKELDTLPLRSSHQVLARYRRDRPHFFSSVGLGAGTGEEWLRLRKMIPHFGEPYDILRGDLEVVADDLIDALKSELDENGEVDILQWLYRWAYESIGIFALYKRLNAFTKHGREEADLMIQAADITNEIIFLTTCNMGDFEEHYKRLVPVQDFSCSVIGRLAAEVVFEQDFCILKKMIEKHADEMQDVITVLQDLFQGAMHTAATTIGVALYNVARHGSIQQEAREELMKYLPEKDSRFSEVPQYGEGIRSLYSIIMETLRLHPPTIGNGRVTKKESVLGGYLIPEGTMVVLQTQVASRLERNFERPMEFLPERHTSLRTSMRNRMSVIEPFGRGRRSCPGILFARNQMNLAIAKILRNFEISYHHEEIDFINKLHNMPDRPIKLRLKPLEH